MTIRRFVVPVTTEYPGDGEAYSPHLSGKLISFRYVKHGVTPFEDGVGFVIISENTGATLWSEEDVNTSATRRPRAATHTTAGVAANYDGSAHAVLDKIVLAQDRVKITVADGGDEKIGTFHITIDG